MCIIRRGGGGVPLFPECRGFSRCVLSSCFVFAVCVVAAIRRGRGRFFRLLPALFFLGRGRVFVFVFFFFRFRRL